MAGQDSNVKMHMNYQEEQMEKNLLTFLLREVEFSPTNHFIRREIDVLHMRKNTLPNFIKKFLQAACQMVRDDTTYLCSSRKLDTDFGYHELLHGEEFYWKFHNHVFEKTLYFCHFYWGNMDKVFDVFNDRKAFPSCADGITTQEGKCYWLVKNNGFYSCKDKCELNNLSQWNKTVSWIGFEIHIINGISNNSYPLKLRCQSKDNDLGNHDLQRNEEFYWKFHIHLDKRLILSFIRSFSELFDASISLKLLGNRRPLRHTVLGGVRSDTICNDPVPPQYDIVRSGQRPAKPQPRNIYPHGFVSGSSRPASQGITHPGIALVHYSLNLGVLMGSEATLQTPLLTRNELK
ncbi:hypothetical protein LguiA_030385 [Lonicera macranthoides]